MGSQYGRKNEMGKEGKAIEGLSRAAARTGKGKKGVVYKVL